jgi:uncharacterized protein YndB with AHSA1/START domain
MQNEVKQTWQFNQPPNEVWNYLVKPELIEQWLMATDFKPEVGHKFTFSHSVKNKSNYEGTTHCEVLEVIPFARLSYKWNGRIIGGGRAYNSTVVWTLVPNENGTELRLHHSGFTVPEDAIAHSSGWNNCIKRFQEHINK